MNVLLEVLQHMLVISFQSQRTCKHKEKQRDHIDHFPLYIIRRGELES